MQFYHLFFVSLIILYIGVHPIKTDRVTTFREFKVVETSSSSDNNSATKHSEKNHMDLSFYVDADEHLEKLKSQAEELRDTFNELIKNAFEHETKTNHSTAIKLTANTTTARASASASASADDDSDEVVVGSARKVSADWVRAAINPILLNNNHSSLNNS